jgi:hypothetical protein
MLEHAQMHDTGNGRLHEEEEKAVHYYFAECAKYDHLWAVMNIFQGDTWIFVVPDPAVVSYYWQKMFSRHCVRKVLNDRYLYALSVNFFVTLATQKQFLFLLLFYNLLKILKESN